MGTMQVPHPAGDKRFTVPHTCTHPYKHVLTMFAYIPCIRRLSKSLDNTTYSATVPSGYPAPTNSNPGWLLSLSRGDNTPLPLGPPRASHRRRGKPSSPFPICTIRLHLASRNSLAGYRTPRSARRHDSPRPSLRPRLSFTTSSTNWNWSGPPEPTTSQGGNSHLTNSLSPRALFQFLDGIPFGNTMYAYQPSMPTCKTCQHAGQFHNWKVRRIWGHCDVPRCICTRYVPRSGKQKPISRVIGRVIYKNKN
jgi:hypothetical protein